MAQKIKIKRGTQSQIDSGSLSLGEMGFTTDTKRLYIGNGIGKTLLSTSWGLLGNGDLQYNDGNPTTSESPTAGNHLANKTYVDNELSGALTDYVKKDGSVAFTGNQSIGGFKLTDLDSPTVSGDAVNKAYADEHIRADGTRTFTGDQSMGGFNITNLNAPSGALDAAHKDYVDRMSLNGDLFETDSEDNLMPFWGKFIFEIDGDDNVMLTEDGLVDADFEIDGDGNIMPKLERVDGGTFI